MDVNISTRSWHYRFYNWTYTLFGRTPPTQTNLCQYVQRMFFTALFGLFFIAVVLSAVGLVLLVPVLVALINISLVEKHQWIGMLIFNSFVLVAIGICVYAYLRDTGKLKRRANNEPNIFCLWLKSKKQKVCPLVNFEE